MSQAVKKFEIRGFHQIWWKLLFTYLAVAAASLGVVIIITREVSAQNYSLHVQHMAERGMGGMMMSSPMMSDLESAFSEAINNSLIWGGVTAVLLAVVLSLIISRRITRPIHDMAAATERIAEGDYEQRVDISSRDEIGSLAHSLNEMAASLDESRRLRRELMSNIAHELKTPLTSISGYMEALEDGVAPANAETYGLVRREALRLSRLVEDMQRLTRAESGQEQLDMVKVEPEPFLERVARKMMPQFAEKGVSLDVAAADGGPRLLADEDKLDQIIVNLLDNALRYTGSGGSVRVNSYPQDGMVAIEVTDTGQGIDARDLPHIFERFYRADKSRARTSGGTGIGLTIVKQYVDALGGRIQVESKVGEGTIFTVMLPPASS
ncbi:MAG: HAMP domain-containing histidine kinase [Thermoleophilia bacterium]|nr:HAMP domain-containing histidine kinase [Thermoleophilia bacterium]